MSEVVLRCPNCGTTQAAAGECEACHEAEVRYFCTNHTPGQWLDGPACASCGARFGVERAPKPTPPRARSATLPPAAPSRGPEPPRRAPERPFLSRRRPSSAPAEPREVVRGPFGVPVRVRRRVPAEPVELPPMGGWPAEVGRREPPAPTRGIPVVGCLVRLVLLVVLFVVFSIGAMLLVFGGGVQSWLVDVGQSTGVIDRGIPEQTQRGIDAYRAGDIALAERELRESAQLYRRSGIALLYLARIRADAGDYTRAGEYLRDAAAREPDNLIVQRELGDHYYESARRLRASQGSEDAVRSQLFSAGEQYLRALRINPDDRRARGYYGCTIAELGQPELAARILDQAGSGPWERCRAAPGRR